MSECIFSTADDGGVLCCDGCDLDGGDGRVWVGPGGGFTAGASGDRNMYFF